VNRFCLFILRLAAFSPIGAPSAYSQDSQENDIIVGDKTIVRRGIFDGPSSRMIAVGNPTGFHYTFDALHAAPVYVWQGAFLDFRAETTGRGGGMIKILGVPRPLEIDKIPLRVGTPDKLPESIRFQGYRRNPETGSPTFLFEVDGVAVEQKLTTTGTDTIALQFSFPDRPTDSPAIFYRIDSDKHTSVDLGEGLKWTGDDQTAVEIPVSVSSTTISVQLKPTDKVFVRKVKKMTGRELFKTYCATCHSTDGTKLIGPGFKGFWGHEQTITRNGKTEKITIDADYVRESIVEPQAAIVKGYEAVPMANFSAALSDEQIDSLVEYLSGL